MWERRWEFPAAILCAALTFVPLLRVPAGFVLLCLLPGLALCRHLLGETTPIRSLLLGSLLSLAVLPFLAIPAALLAGRPGHLMTVMVACGATGLACLRKVAPPPAATLPAVAARHLTLILVTALLLQIGLSFAVHPTPDTIRWKGLPDLMFFNGIYTQILLHTPPLDPENGGALLVHNWIYHFHFALVELVTGLTTPAMMRLVSIWMGLTFLGLVYLACVDLLRQPSAGLAACLLLMTSGEIHWLVRSVRQMSLTLEPMSWAESPMGLTLLFGWYNLPPLAAAVAAWLTFERYRQTGLKRMLAMSVWLCAVMAFFHPVFFGVFMIGFCLWLAWRWLHEGYPLAWLAYLATPIPFFLFYKLPYYGMTMPPRVVHPTLTAAFVGAQASELVHSAGLTLGLALVGLYGLPRRFGPLPFVLATSLALGLLVRSPNPHWFSDLVHVAASILSGAGLAWLVERFGGAGRALAAAVFLTATVSFGLHVQGVLSVSHTFSEGERAAGAWLRERTLPDDLVAIVPNSRSSFTVLGLGQRRLVHGWTGHLLDFHADARAQERDLHEMFASEEPAAAGRTASRYGVRHVYVGPAERGVMKPGSLDRACFPQVFSWDEIELREFTCAGAP